MPDLDTGKHLLFGMHGVISRLLGIAIWRQYPLSGLRVIGLFAGMDMVFNGRSPVILGLATIEVCAANEPRGAQRKPGLGERNARGGVHSPRIDQ